MLGAERRNHSSMVPKTGLRLVCSTRAKTCLYGHIKRPARITKIYPTRVAGKTDRPAPARHSVIFLQVIIRWLMRSKIKQNLLYLGMLHEGHKRADRSLGGSVLGIPVPACSMRAASEPTDRSGPRCLEYQNGTPHEGHKRADRLLGGSALGNNYRLLADLRKHLLQPGELQE